MAGKAIERFVRGDALACDLKNSDIIRIFKEPPPDLDPGKAKSLFSEASVRMTQGQDPGDRLFDEVAVLASKEDGNLSEMARNFLEKHLS